MVPQWEKTSVLAPEIWWFLTRDATGARPVHLWAVVEE